MRRAIVLWICAALLGLSAAWIRLGSLADDRSKLLAEAKQSGFDSVADYRTTFELLGHDENRNLSSQTVSMLLKYADHPASGTLVANVIPTIADENSAILTIPVCRKLFAVSGNATMRSIIREEWNRRKLNEAVRQLDLLGASPNQ